MVKLQSDIIKTSSSKFNTTKKNGAELGQAYLDLYTYVSGGVTGSEKELTHQSVSADPGGVSADPGGVSGILRVWSASSNSLPASLCSSGRLSLP